MRRVADGAMNVVEDSVLADHHANRVVRCVYAFNFVLRHGGTPLNERWLDV